MTDIEVWRLVIRIVLVVAAICTASFPVCYAFSPWNRSWLGRVLMLQGVALAAIFAVTVVFQFWRGTNAIRFLIYLVVILAIAFASATMTGMMIKYNFRARTRRSLMSDTANETFVADTNPEQKTYPLLSNSAYDKLKPVTTLLMPAVVTFILGVGEIWNIESAPKIGATLGAFNVLLGVLLAVATRSYNNSDDKFDGTVDVQHLDGRKVAVMDITTEPETMLGQKQVTLKVNNP